MKILMITYHGGAGGVSVIIANIINYLKKYKDMQIDVCYASFLGSVGQKVKEICNNTYCLNMNNGYSLFKALKLIRIIKNGNYDIVHLHYFTPLLRIVTYISNPKIIIQTEHGGIKGEIGTKRWILMKWIHRILKKTANYYTTVSLDSRKDLVENKLVPSNKVLVIYNGINIEKFYRDKCEREELRSELNIDNDEIVIGTVRSLTSKMGIDHLIQASSLLVKKYKNIRILIIGDGPLRKNLEYMCKKLELSNKVIFLGERLDIRKCLSCMDIFVMPSVWETFGIAAVEAMAVGLPVVAYAVGGLKEVVKDKVTGLLVEERSFENLSLAISSLIENPNLLIDLGKKSKERARKYFGISQCADKYYKLYKKLAKCV